VSVLVHRDLTYHRTDATTPNHTTGVTGSDMQEVTDVKKSDSLVEFSIDLDDEERFTLCICTQDVALRPSAEAYVAATLLPAMQVRRDVRPPGPLDPQFADSLNTVQDIFTTWHPALRRVQILAGRAFPESRGPRSGKIAVFFTGGVDSFYTLLKHESEIDALLYVHGFDVALSNLSLRRQVSRMVRAVGARFDKQVIEVETNLRAFSDRHTRWEQYHGAALATVGLTLPKEFSQCLIPSSFPYNYLRIWGSHPLLDPLWSTDGLTIIHDGCEASRFNKCKLISRNEAARRYLRVCWKNPEGAYNCGRCEKCIRTMTFLVGAGALDKCSTFGEMPPVKRIVWDEEIQDTIRRLSYQYLPALEVLREKPEVRPLVRAIESAVQDTSLRAKVCTVLRKAKARAHQLSSVFVP